MIHTLLTRLTYFFSVFLIASPICDFADAQNIQKLPDLGSSAATLLSPKQEMQIGRSMLQSLRKSGQVLDDRLLQEYLETLGYRITAQSNRPEQSFTFFLVRSTDINAFAAPGGYIGVNTGLITLANSADELAAVLAHETAHITQRHLLRWVERTEKSNLPILLAMLGAVIASQGSNGDAIEAAVIGGSALMQQQQINFTRENEAEADRLGIEILSQSGLNPLAMADFFDTMGKTLRVNHDTTPEFLRSHPLTTTRISEAKSRAKKIQSQTHLSQATSITNTKYPNLAFLLFRERARVLGDSNTHDKLNFYKRWHPSAKEEGIAKSYGLALAQTYGNQSDKAVLAFEKLHQTYPKQLNFALGLAEAQYQSKQNTVALKLLKKLHATHPDHQAITMTYAQQLTATGSPENARRAMKLLRPMTQQVTQDALLLFTFARACELANEPIRAAETHADIAILNGRYNDAINQLKRLLERKDLNYYQHARVASRIAELTPYALEEVRQNKDHNALS